MNTLRRAWHCGRSSFLGQEDVNDYSIGVCFGNKNDGREPYTDQQYETGAELVRVLMERYPSITRDRITTHAAIAVPVGRKTDPGPLFDLDRFLGML